jgi:hypothetical protein
LWDEMAEAGNCLAVIDEAHMWFSARQWTKTEQAQLAVFQQHRKEGVDLVWVAQHEARVDVAIRELTAFIWRHRRIGRFVLATKVTPDEPKKPVGRQVVPIRRGIFQHYFSEERIGFRDGEGYAFGGGAQFRRQPGLGPSLDEHHRLRANYYRVEFPGSVRYLRADAPFVAEVVGSSLLEWAGCGVPRGAESICRPLYRGVDGRFHELDLEGAFVANAVELELYEQAHELAKTLIRSARGVFSPRPNLETAGRSSSVKPVAAASRALPRPVPEEGLRGVGRLAKIGLRPGGAARSS